MSNWHGLAGKAESYWTSSVPESTYPALHENIEADVAVVGGGFVGLYVAYSLKQAGMRVAVLEGNRILQGVTGHTTAKITSLHRLIYGFLLHKYGKEKALQYGASNEAAISQIASMVQEHTIDCDFSRLPFFTYALDDQSLAQVEEETKAAQDLGLPASFVNDAPVPFKIRGAVRFDNQAQFHPLKFLLRLASSIPGNGSHIFENTRVTDLQTGTPCTLIAGKATVKARNAIVATNFPIFDKEGLYFARLKPSRSYSVAIRTAQSFPDVMCIDAAEEGYAWRYQPDAGGQLIIISGGSHSPGHEGDTRANYQELHNVARKIYGDAAVEYSWSTQDNIPFDGVPYIGQLDARHDNVYVATGFSKWGMTTSVVAGMVLSDLVQEKSNPWANLYNPLRFKADASAAKKLISQNAHIIKTLVGGHLGSSPDMSALGNGEGGIVEDKGKKMAIYRDDTGQLYRLRPSCTHMGCTLHWNNAERSWDCPCHGSRFDYKGGVIHSPATKSLQNLATPSDH